MRGVDEGPGAVLDPIRSWRLRGQGLCCATQAGGEAGCVGVEVDRTSPLRTLRTPRGLASRGWRQ
eukprot:11904595-Alexandrium_andersonii.AAC.1